MSWLLNQLVYFKAGLLLQVNSSEIPEPEKVRSFDSPEAMVMAMVTASLFLGIYGYNYFVSVFWDRGIYPPFYRDTWRRRCDAYVHLGVIILRFEAEDIYPKLQIMQRFIVKRFPSWEFDLLESYKFAKTNLVTTESVCKWLLKKGIKQEEKSELLNVLFDIAVCDGQLGKSEYRELRLFCSKMGISVLEFDQKVTAFQDASFRTEQEKRKQEDRFAGRSADAIKRRHTQVLGLKDGFTAAELKKSYRKMVKSCHPDMVKPANPQEKELLNERFLEIQEAYEYLMRLV